MPWFRRFVTICIGVFAAVVLALVLLVSFVDLGLSGHGITALFIGALVTTGLGMALMALVFVSDRDGRDARVHAAGTVGEGADRLTRQNASNVPPGISVSK